MGKISNFSPCRLLTCRSEGPVILKRTVKTLLSAAHPELSVEDSSMLSQRATRAIVASSLLLGAWSTFPHSSWADNVFLGSCYTAQYMMMGTVLYYAFDCVVLIGARDFNRTMWMHHLSAMGLFLTFSYSGLGHGGAMYVLLSEGLVPWGFALFYLKRTKREKSLVFRAVTVGGFCFILFRASLWLRMAYALWLDYPVVPMWFRLLIVWAFATGLLMEYVWGSLYLGNIKRAFRGNKA